MTARFKLILICFFMIIFVGCNNKKITYKVIEEPIVFEQTDQEFTIDMLADFIEVKQGKKVLDLNNLHMDGTVNLRKVGVSTITLSLNENEKNPDNAIKLSLSIIDKTPPQILIYEDEFLVSLDEELTLETGTYQYYLFDGLNGLIGNRLKVSGSYDLNAVGTYPLVLSGEDDSGNQTQANVNIRVTDNIDERAMYLYDKSTALYHGEYFIYYNNNKANNIINYQFATSHLTNNLSNEFLYYSGISGEYNSERSGVKLLLRDSINYYVDLSIHKHREGYQDTRLVLQEEDSAHRRYEAISTYKVNGVESTMTQEFVIIKNEGKWEVAVFYLPY